MLSKAIISRFDIELGLLELNLPACLLSYKNSAVARWALRTCSNGRFALCVARPARSMRRTLFLLVTDVQKILLVRMFGMA